MGLILLRVGAATAHAAQGRTVDVGHALADVAAGRQWLYVAMSRGRTANYAYCVTGYPGLADAAPGSRPAPELARADQLAQDHAGLAPAAPASQDPDPRRDEVAVLAGVLARDTAARSATETLRAGLADADHLGVLGTIWYDQARQAQAARFETALRAALPAPLAEEAAGDPACAWLWRSLRHAETTGLDGPEILRRAITARELGSARNIARVLDQRVRRITASRPPLPRGTWASQVPVVADPQIGRFLGEVAQAMDDRIRRIGDHAAATRPAWAVTALGPPPAGPDAAAGWRERAGVIGGYRELYGIDSQTDPIGPEPALTSPEARADWHTASAALGQAGGPDPRALTDSRLRLRRAAYQRELAWAPPYVAEDLRLIRVQARTAWENTIRAQHLARAATDPAVRARHAQMARTWAAMHAKATEIAVTLAAAQETRRQWARLTDATRTAGLAADTELRRRHPDARLTPLVPAQEAAQASGQAISQIFQQPEGTPAAAVPGPAELTGLDISPAVAEQVTRIAKQAHRAQEQIDYLAGLPEYADEHQTIFTGPAWDVLARRQRDAIIQSPRPEIVPAAAVLQRAQSQTVEREAET